MTPDYPPVTNSPTDGTTDATGPAGRPKPSAYTPASDADPCMGCGATSGWCRRGTSTVGCVNVAGPLSQQRVASDGTAYHAHPLDPDTGRMYEPVPDQTQQFFGALFEPDDLIVLRQIEQTTKDGKKADRYVGKHYHRAAELAQSHEIWSHLVWTNEREMANLYYGVAPRVDAKHFDLAWQIRRLNCVFADLDNCSVADGLAKCEAAGLPSPTVVVKSGSGVHLYWRLDQPYVIDDAGNPAAVYKEFKDQGEGRKKKVRQYMIDPATREKRYRLPKGLSPKARAFQAVLAGVARRIGGDNVHDPSRLLRVVGTLNRKNQRNGRTPVPCELIECDPSRRYPFSVFEPFAVAVPDTGVSGAPCAQIRLPCGRKLTAGRKNKLGEFINNCVIETRDRSRADFALCCWAVRKGLNPEDVWAEVKDESKFAERGREYFDLTWKNAEEAVRTELFERNRGEEAGTGGGAPAGGTPPEAGRPSPGEGGGDGPRVFERIDDPYPLAQDWLCQHARLPDGLAWRHFRRSFWRWDQSRYWKVPDDEMEGLVTSFLKPAINRRCRTLYRRYGCDDGTIDAPPVTRSLVANVIQHIKSAVLLPDDTPFPAWLEDGRAEGRNYMAVANGLLDIDAAVAGDPNPLRDHSPRWFSPVAVSYRYEPTATCPKWDAFLARNLGDDQGKAPLLRQWYGYTLTPDTDQQRFLMMAGEGGNGKSVACAVQWGLLGADNVSSVGLEFFRDKFHLAGTLGKLANVVAEVGDLDRLAEGQLKAFVSGDQMMFEEKFKPPFYARPTARLVLATNNPPQFSDRSDGIWRRVLMIRFNVRIPEGDRVKGMDKAEFWERSGELPGILNWALAGLRDLRAQGQFTVPECCDDDLRAHRLDSNPAARFLTEHYHAAPQGSVPSADLYQHYKRWCEANGHRVLADSSLGKEVVRAFPVVKKQRPGGRTNRRWVYSGLAAGEGPSAAAPPASDAPVGQEYPVVIEAEESADAVPGDDVWSG